MPFLWVIVKILHETGDKKRSTYQLYYPEKKNRSLCTDLLTKLGLLKFEIFNSFVFKARCPPSGNFFLAKGRRVFW